MTLSAKGNDPVDSDSMMIASTDDARDPILRATPPRASDALKAEAADPATAPTRLAELAARSGKLARVVARNPAAPAAALERLAHESDPALLQAIAAHPATPLATLQQLAGRLPEGLLENPALDWVLLENPTFFQELSTDALRGLVSQERCPDWLLGQAALVGDEPVQLEVCRQAATPAETLRALHVAPSAAVREAASLHVALVGVVADWQNRLRLAVMRALESQRGTRAMAFLRLADQVSITGPKPATALYRVLRDIGRLYTDRAVMERLAHHHRWPVRGIVALRPDIPGDLLDGLARDSREEVRAAVAGNPIVSPACLRRLAGDPRWPVRLVAAHHPDTPADGLKSLMAAKNDAVRQAIAGNPGLAANHLRRLASDPDPAVRVAVAGNPATPTTALEQLATDLEIKARQAVAGNPSTPEETLKRLAGEPVRRIRAAIAGNPAASATLLERLAKEAPFEVLLTVAGNPAASKALLKQLAADLHGEIRRAVAGNPAARRWGLRVRLPEAAETPVDPTAKPALASAFDPLLPPATLEAMLDSQAYPDFQLLELLRAKLTRPTRVLPRSASLAAKTDGIGTLLTEQAQALVVQGDLGSRLLALLSPWAPAAALAERGRSPWWEERAAIAAHPATSPLIRAKLAEDGNAVVRAAARVTLR